MLEIAMNGVTKNYGFADILRGADLEIMSGDRVAIVGRNGSGKSTILKIIAGEEGVNSGAVTLRRGASLGYLEQIPQLMATDTPVRAVLMEPFAQVLSLEGELRAAEGDMAITADPDALERLMRRYARLQEEFERLGGYAIEDELSRVCAGFGIADLLDRPFNVLSGGQKTIVSLAKVVLAKPDILLLDEPTNHLDIRALEWFEDFLRKYKGAALVVSHDRYFLDQVATRVISLEDGSCTAYAGSYTKAMEERERQLLVEFAHYKTQQKKIEAMQAAIRRYRVWGVKNKAFFIKAKELEKRLAKMEVVERPQMEAKQIPLSLKGGRTGHIALRLDGLSLSIGGLSLLEDVRLELYHKDRMCLLGGNGTGKTTLLRSILGELPCEEGQMTIAPSASIGYIPQEIRFPDDKASVLEAFRAEHLCAEGEARNILAQYFFYGQDVFKRVGALSGGEKVLLKLAVLVRREVNFLVLDEPTNHIDIQTRELLEEALLAFPGTLLFVSHDRYFIRKIATRIAEIEGRALTDFQGNYDDYRASRAKQGGG